MTKRNKVLYIICLIGLVVRLGFILYGAKVYFNRENIFVDGDTGAWGLSIQNLIHQGVYTLNPDNEYGYFGRMPGYSFFMGIFYLVFGQHWKTAYVAIAWFQTLLDVVTIGLVYKIALRLFGNVSTAAVTALIYALYPFIIVWTPVVYSEYMSVFFMISALYFLTHSEHRYYISCCAACLGVGALFRPQLLLLIPLVGIYLLYKYRGDLSIAITRAATFGIIIVLTYGSWPIRNYVFHHKVILTQDLRGMKNWNIDVIAFLQYIYAVKPEWEPQFTQIVTNEKVVMPAVAYAIKDDSALVDHAIRLSQTCGSGFSYWKGYWKSSFDTPNCNDEIASAFIKLRTDAINHDPFRFYVTLPLLNLKKAVFKISLNDSSTPARKVAGLLFLYRTLLIIIGLIGAIRIIMSKQSNRWFAVIALMFFLMLYVALCAGTGPQFRNIEMRYFLQPDILLIFPAGWWLAKLYATLFKKSLAVTV